MTRPLILGIAFIAAALLVFATEVFIAWPAREQAVPQNLVTIGGPFSMTDHRGRSVSEKNFQGKARAVFFGFTACPDICPTMLTRMASLLDQLGADADKVNVILVSVDPERDTPDVLASYLQAFDPRITGLTGTAEQLADFAKRYRVFYEKVAGEGGSYTMNHTSGVLLFDADGNFQSIIDGHEAEEMALKKLERVISG
ncbi:MAG: SCO family protein [Rhizobiales bacterium]|nr:SCO family protein [Hyphomicrobiales bacterium]